MIINEPLVIIIVVLEILTSQDDIWMDHRPVFEGIAPI